MHPWSMQRLAQERQGELARAALCARTSNDARQPGPGGAHPVNRRATRFLGELLIRTGWRLVGPEVPSNGVRPRLALRAPGAVADPC
jgi:hypothetical protein